MSAQHTVYVIACRVLGPEIKKRVEDNGLQLKMKFLSGKLHNIPDLLRASVQSAIDGEGIAGNPWFTTLGEAEEWVFSPD